MSAARLVCSGGYLIIRKNTENVSRILRLYALSQNQTVYLHQLILASAGDAERLARMSLHFPHPYGSYRYSLRVAGWAILVGALAGSSSALFLWLLDLATLLHRAQPWLLWTLPAAGLLVGWLYAAHGRGVGRGNNFLLEEIHHPREAIPLRMVPFVLLGTLLTHLAGGSAGREGTAVQMGGSLADGVSRWFKLDTHCRRLMLFAGIAGGFGAVFGTPWAGAVFALEVVVISRLQWSAWLPVLLASFVGHYTCLAWGIAHTEYHGLAGTVLNFSWMALGKFILLGVSCGLMAQLYGRSTQLVQWGCGRLSPWAPLRPVIGGCLVIALVFLTGTRDFLGLGVTSATAGGASILASFAPTGMDTWAWLGKLVFTAITIGSGFKGGEVTPLFFVGAAWGHTAGIWAQEPVPLYAGLGFVAVFAAAAKTPLACAIMAGELFGWQFLIPAAVVCEFAFLCSGKSSIYTSQRHHRQV
jgi:H+/Cl- antiporter ClcA